MANPHSAPNSVSVDFPQSLTRHQFGAGAIELPISIIMEYFWHESCSDGYANRDESGFHLPSHSTMISTFLQTAFSDY